MPIQDSLSTRGVVLSICFALLLCSGFVSAQNFDHSKWNLLLQSQVQLLDQGRATRVSYEGMLENRSSLHTYLDELSSVEQSTFDNWSKPEQLAFLINAYNSWTVELILTEYPVDSIKDIGFLFSSPWRRQIVSLFGRQLSLDEIEHEIIRASGLFNEPRIHFAVNCAAIGCPALRNEAYMGERLDQQLGEATRLFLSDKSRNYFSNNRLYVSSIFDWYEEDFEKSWQGINSLAEFFANYTDELGMSEADARALAEGRIRISFLRYDWSLNDSR